MKKIALINDLSGLGKCSLTASIPVISALGIQACPLPTAILSAQTGFKNYYYDDYTDKMNKFTDEWSDMDLLFDGIYSGFLGNAKQMHNVLYFLDKFQTEDTIYLADPIIGDNGVNYSFFTEKLLDAIKHLTQRANIITPNLTELCLLAQADYNKLCSYSNSSDYLKSIKDIGYNLLKNSCKNQTILVTGIIRPEKDNLFIGNMAINKDYEFYVETPYTQKSFSGTGDLYASVVIGCLVKGIDISDAMKKATTFLQPAIEEASIQNIDRNHGVNFEKYLNLLWSK